MATTLKQSPRIIILKTGSTFPELARRLGDFEDWTISRLGATGKGAEVVDARSGIGFPSPQMVTGVVITGSHDMVSDRADWSERTARWLAACIARNTPVLGICYGHQLLAHAMGGKVTDNPRGREFGTRMIGLLPDAKDDLLFGEFCKRDDKNANGGNDQEQDHGRLQVHLCHTQSVIIPPGQAKILAKSDMDECQAFRLGEYAWGVQFHPEFPAEALRYYIERHAEILRSQGEDVEALIHGCRDNETGEAILSRFGSIAFGKTF